jgi:hypothetical protein
MRPRLEKYLEEDVVHWWCGRPEEFLPLQFKLNLQGNNGWPDRIFLHKGRVLFIEFKRVGEDPTPLQVWRHKMLKQQCFQIEVCEEYYHAVRILEAFLEAPRLPEAGHAADVGTGVSRALLGPRLRED